MSTFRTSSTGAQNLEPLPISIETDKEGVSTVIKQEMNRRTFLGQMSILASLNSFLGSWGQIKVTKSQDSIGRRVVLSCPTANLDEFRQLVEVCVEAGVTHVDISDLPKARWQWYEPSDPWPNWGMLQASFFKIAPPEELKHWIPADYTHRCQEILAERGGMLRKMGLKASFSGAEPMWLPEGVYQAHPEWRGPRCQYPPRARNDYYTPCIDRPEVLELYRKAVATVARLVPVEEFKFLANDSGSGICWHPGLYPGKNGPEYCKDRPMNERLDGWMRAVQAGASDAGMNADVTIAGRSTTPDKQPRQTVTAGPSNYLYFSNLYPVIGIPQPWAFAEQMQEIPANPKADVRLNVETVRSTALLDVLREEHSKPSVGVLGRAKTLDKVAARHAGVEGGPHLLRAWELIGRAAKALAPIEEGGPILMLGSVNQRWLIRPLVPFPLELKPEEKDYYRRFQMQAWSEQIAANLMALQGNYLIQGPASTWLACRMFDDAMRSLGIAHEELKLAIVAAPAMEEVSTLDVRVQALILTIRNAKLTAQYQEFLDRQMESPHSRPDPKWPRLDLEEGMKIAEADIENTKQLIALMKSTKVQLFGVAPTVEQEDIFLFNPNLLGQLQTKVETQQRHLPDHIRL